MAHTIAAQSREGTLASAPQMSIPRMLRGELLGATPPLDTSQDARSIAYQIQSVIGEGGMGVVYLALQQYPSRRVALKVLKGSLVAGDLLQRFEREIEILASLQHPGIARLLSAGTMSDPAGVVVPFMAMEYISGRPIQQYAAENKLSLKARLQLFLKVCEAVRYVHANGIIHRDLTANNILVDEGGQPKVLDFGLATFAAVNRSPHLTDAGKPLGTLHYMSPEQAGGKIVNQQADVYALGVVLYELLSGRTPHDLRQMDLVRALRQIQEVIPKRLSLFNHACRGDIETVVTKAMSRDRSQRYATVADFSEDVRRILEKEPVLARRPSPSYLVRKFVQRHSLLVTSVVIIICSLAAAVVLISREANRANAEARRANIELAQTSVAEGDALLAAERFTEARQAFNSAFEQFRREGVSNLPARLGLWELDQVSARPVRTLLPDGRLVQRVALSPNDRLIALGFTNGLVEVYNAETNAAIVRFQIRSNVNELKFSSDSRRIAAAASGEYAIWSTVGKGQLKRAQTENDVIAKIALGVTRTVIATKESLSIEDETSQDPVVVPIQVREIGLDPNGNIIAIDLNRFLWRANAQGTNFLKIGLIPGNHAVRPILSPSGSSLLVDDQKDLIVFSTDAIEERHRIEGIKDLRDFGFAGDERVYMQHGRDGPYELVELNGKPSLKFDGMRGHVAASTGTQMVAMDLASNLKLFSIVEAPGVTSLSGKFRPVNAVDLDSSGALAALATDDGKIHLYDLNTEMETASFTAKGGVQGVKFESGGRRLVLGTTDGLIQFWDIASRKRVSEINTRADLQSFDVSSQIVITCNRNPNRVCLWQWRSGQWQANELPTESEVTRVSLSRDGRTALFSGMFRMETWSVQNAPHLLNRYASSYAVPECALSFDGSFAVAKIDNLAVQLSRLKEHASASPVVIHSAAQMPIKVAITPEGQIALTDGFHLFVLDSNGSPVRRLNLPLPSCAEIVTSRDGRILMRDSRGDVVIYKLPLNDDIQ